MSCEICAMESTDDSVMWTCAGCPRKFHATCVGVSVQRNSLRRKEKKIDVQSYILPCCTSCQNLITLNFEVKALAEQQAELTEKINENTEITHRFSKQNNVQVVHEAIDRLEILLNEIKKELSSSRSGGSTSNVPAIKNHITSLFDIAMQASKENISTSLKTITSGISKDLSSLHEEVNQLSNLTMDMVSSASMHSNSVLELDILDELKLISANIQSNQATHSSLDSAPTLKTDLQHTRNNADVPDRDISGWRILGNRKVWKADWTEYDARQLRRMHQQKLAEQARKRRRQFNARLNAAAQSNNNNSNTIPHIHRRNQNNNRNMSINNNRNNNNSNNNYRNNNKNNNYRNKNNNNNYYYRTSHNSNNNSNSNNNNSNRNNNNNNNWINNNSNSNSRINRNNRSSTYSHDDSNLLPSDRELLAAAKERFSRPPAPYRPTIDFQRGEVLNPYPAGSSSVFCEGCSCSHPSFRRN